MPGHGYKRTARPSMPNSASRAVRCVYAHRSIMPTTPPTEMRVRTRGPLRLFADALDELSSPPGAARAPQGLARPDTGLSGPAFLVTAKLRSAMAAFLLSPASVDIDEVSECWDRVIRRLCEFHGALRLPETALLAENLVGLAVHRLGAALPDVASEAISAMEDVRACVLNMTSPNTVARIEAAGLRASSPLGPATVRMCVDDWIDRWRAITESCLRFDPRASIQSTDELTLKMPPVPLGQPSRSLVAPKYSLIFPAPFVQAGLAHLAHISNWVSLFSTHLQRIDDASLTPLTRVLFTLSLVDEYLAGKGQRSALPEQLLMQFHNDTREVPPSVLIPPIEANRMPRSREEVRVSSALTSRSPRNTCTPPGMLLARVRTDAALFDADSPFLSADALAVFQPAVSTLLQHGETPSEGAQKNLLALLQQTWTVLQAASTPSSVIGTLINAGFTPLHCKHYLAALESFLAGGGQPDAAGAGLSEIQQLFGCISLMGSSVFDLAREYGYSVDYVKAFKRLQGSGEQLHVQLCEAVGLAGGALSQTLARIMGPPVPTEHLASLRRAVVGEFEVAERRFSSGKPSLLRETALLWADVYGQTHWDIAPQMEHGGGGPSVALLPSGRQTHAASVLRAAAAQIQFPLLETATPAVLSDPGFSPYVMAMVVGDALMATCNAAFLTKPLEFASHVLAWARDFGLGYLPTVDGHRAKLGALITLLEPAVQRGELPTMQMAENVERLLRELHASVRAAEGQLFPNARAPRVPPPEVGNSLLLISMYALAARGVLSDLARRADALTQHLEDAVVSLRIHTQTLAAFFECRFESDGRKLYAVPRDGGERLGPWRPNDAADAVSQYCGMYHDAKRALVSALSGLRSVIVEATAHRAACDELAAQVAHEGNVLASALRDVNSFVMLVSGIHARASRLLSGGQVPGFVHMGQFMVRWRKLSTAYKSVQSAASPEQVAGFVQELHETWRGIQAERILSSASQSISPEQRAAAVGEIMMHVEEDHTGMTSEPHMSVLTSRCNLGAWGDYDLGPLGRDTTVPDSVDLSPRGLNVLLGMEWLLMQELLQVTDGVFRNPARRHAAGPQDIEVRESGSSQAAEWRRQDTTASAMDHGSYHMDHPRAPNQPEENDYDMGQ
ncbi:tegument protein UL37 [Bovine alphaherpesvirus 2]|uniref:Tegument protein UL37 n=1 Tax=Bovine alphaherpesvirus 2 TaxID=10295 RepID=A0ABX6WQK3_9ALPH|nr:tegument protein UL37 [Bovine alphaherpesvirus 2]QPO25170.1 tegument protein UL37 [Bovine alphaherpesvirus 2]